MTGITGRQCSKTGSFPPTNFCRGLQEGLCDFIFSVVPFFFLFIFSLGDLVSTRLVCHKR